MKKLLSIILAVLMIATTIPFAFAAESDSTKTTLDVSEGNIVIADTYVTQNGEHVELDPDGYIITGKSENVDTVLEFINESSNTVTFNVVFDNLYIQAADYCTALRIKGEGPIILNIELVGTNNIKSSGHDAFSNQGNSTLVVNLSTGSDSSNTFQSSGRFYDKDNTIVYLDGTEMDEYGHVHSGGTQACGGYECEDCGDWYGEGTGEHTGGTQTCMGYMCETCYNWYGKADETKHGWHYGYCEFCGEICEHPSFENGSCTVCTYTFPFSLTTGETVIYPDSFAEAYEAAEDGSIIKLMKDFMDYKSMDIEKAITIDLNGHNWDQPSSASHTVKADVTFTDSVGGGETHYGIFVYNDCTFSGGTYRYISIDTSCDFTLDDILGECCNYYDSDTDELLDLSGQTYVDYPKIKAEHKLTEVVAKAPTCTEAGYEAYEHCTECTYTTYKEIPSSGHTEEVVKGYNATCTETGLTDGIKCSACGETLTAQTEIAAKGHADANGDGVCDNGGEAIEKQEPDTPDEPSDEPTDDTTNDCDHLCHKSGFMGFIWKIIRFFIKLFKTQPVCECGAAHY